MRIAIDISQIVYEGTGVATYTRNLVESLLRLDKKNEYILFGVAFRHLDILENFFSKAQEIRPNVLKKFIFIPPTLANIIWNSWHILPVELLVGPIDIFHSSDWTAPPTNAKKVTTIHDLVVFTFPQTSDSHIISTQKRRLQWVKREIDCIISDSYATRDDVVRILKIPKEKIQVLHPGISKEFTPQPKSEIERVKRKYALFDDYLLNVGTMEPRKNLPILFEAFAEFETHSLIRALRKPIELVITGKAGWGGEKLTSRKFIRFIGYVDQKDLPALYSGAREFIYPSLYEGFGIPVLESMACGCPVITSERGSLRELVNGHGLTIDPADSHDISQKMVQCMVDGELRYKLVKDAKTYIARFNWISYARKMIGIYGTIGKDVS